MTLNDLVAIRDEYIASTQDARIVTLFLLPPPIFSDLIEDVRRVLSGNPYMHAEISGGTLKIPGLIMARADYGAVRVTVTMPDGSTHTFPIEVSL